MTMSKNDKRSLFVLAVVIIILLLLWRGKTIVQKNGDFSINVPGVEPLNANLHSFDVPAVKYILSFPEFHLFAATPGCKCQSTMVH